MLVRLLYASKAAASVDADAFAAITRRAQQHNPAVGVTGVLCHCATSGVFMQLLEGGRQAVSTLYNAIARDSRHHDVMLLGYDEIGERRFSWPMGVVNMGRLNPSLVLKYSETATVDPYAVPGRASLALFEELVATASIVTTA